MSQRSSVRRKDVQIALTFETAFYEVHLVALGLDSCILCTALYEAGGGGNWLVGCGKYEAGGGNWLDGWLWQISFRQLLRG